MVLWVVAIAGVILAGIQAHAYGQASAGREALARVRAFWAARSGLELALARTEFDSLNPDTSNAYRLFDDLSASANRRLDDSAFRLAYSDADGDHLGARDSNAKININLMTSAQLATLPNMPEDGPDSILDWRDADDDTKPMGAERGYYQSRRYPVTPRNGNLKTIAELELIVGMTTELVRGEDWNLNGRLDPNEDDGDASWPPDNADGRLDAGLSGILTTSSIDGGLAASGQERLDLTTATAAQLSQRLGVDTFQADAIAAYGASSGASMVEFIRRELRQLAQQSGTTAAIAANIRALDRTQLGALYNECSIGASDGGKPGKLNINTCDAQTLEYLPEMSAGLADAVIYERSTRPEGFQSIIDLLDVPSMTRQRLAGLASIIDVRSNAVTVSSRGRDAKTGIEVEITAVIDRSTIPATMSEYRVQ